MGPVAFTSAIRMEGKHLFFKKVVHDTGNFININKTLAHKHQEMLALNESPYEDAIILGKKKKYDPSSDDFNQYLESLEQQYVDVFELNVVKSLKFNGISYKRGLLINVNKIFYEIDYIISIESEFAFLCSAKFLIKDYNIQLNSLVLERSNDCQVFTFSNLENRNCYEKISVNCEFHVITANLLLYYMHTV